MLISIAEEKHNENETMIIMSIRQLSLYFINLLKTKRRLLYLNTQFIPRCKHFPPQL